MDEIEKRLEKLENHERITGLTLGILIATALYLVLR